MPCPERTAAGMSSISANAMCYTSHILYVGTHTALGYVNFLPGQQYTGAVTAQGDDCICYKGVTNGAYRYGKSQPVACISDYTYTWYEDVYATTVVSCDYHTIITSARARYRNGNNPYYETPTRSYQFNLGA